MVLKLISLNTREIRDKAKRRTIFNYCRNRADICCLQETHSIKHDEVGWELEWNGPILISHGTNVSKGVCILFKKGNYLQRNI